MECSWVIFFCLFELVHFPSKYKHLPNARGVFFFFSLHCFSSFSAVQIWMQSNRDAGGGLLGADESRQTEEEKGGGGRGEREGASIPSLSQILPPSDHESQP